MDIASVSAVVAAGGVIIGVVLAYLEIRNLVEARQADLAMRVHSTWMSEGMMEKWVRMMRLEFEDYDDFKKKFGSFPTEEPEQIAVYSVTNHFEAMGYLLKRKLVDFEIVDLEPVSITWEKTKPIIEGLREEYNPRMYEFFEYLYKETKKRSQKLMVQQ